MSLHTERLKLRQWRKEDVPLFAELCADPEVMAHFPTILNLQESQELAHRLHGLIDQQGWGFWAVEVVSEKKFIGFVGLHKTQHALPFTPCVEIGWRLARQAWGQGYAQEAARAALVFAFEHLNLKEVVSFTTVKNDRSIAVMRALGMQDTQQNFIHNFMGSAIEASDLQCEHVLYKLTQTQWRKQK